MIKYILIDVDNTLLDFDKCADTAIRQGFLEYNLPYSENTLPTFLKINDSLWNEIEKGTLTKPQLYDVRWNTIFSALNILADGVAFENRFHALVEKSHETVEGAKELLSYLSKKYVVCVASNASLLQQQNRLKAANLAQYISYYFVSEEAQAPKPSPKFFDFCFSRLNNPEKSEVFLIGDSPFADISGAVEYGIGCCWFKRKNNLESGYEPTFEVSSLINIKNYL